MHAEPYSDKFTTFTLQCGQKIRAPLPYDGGDGAGGGGQFQRLALAVGNEDAFGNRPRQHAAHGPQQGLLAQAAVVPGRKLRIGIDDAREGRQASRPGHAGRRRAAVPVVRRVVELNIILVSGATARVRSVTLDWRHYAAAGFSLLIVVVALASLFNFVTLRWAAAVQHPWLQTILLAEQRQEAARMQEKVQGHLSAMAVRLGELQAQMMRLDGLGERLAKAAGLKPQDLQSMQPGTIPGRGGAAPTSSRPLTVDEFTGLVERLARDVEARSDQLSVLEALIVQGSASRSFLPSLRPVADGWYSSNFGVRIDPFSGESAFHEGIDFPAETGTPVLAAASGKVVYAGFHPQYGKMIEVDHGSGLVSRYAHASQVNVGEGDFVVRGQRIGAVGSTGRSTGPHLHFEVRLFGVPQNPVRFLASS